MGAASIEGTSRETEMMEIIKGNGTTIFHLPTFLTSLFQFSADDGTALKLSLSNEFEYFIASVQNNDCAVAPNDVSFEDICNDVRVHEH